MSAQSPRSPSPKASVRCVAQSGSGREPTGRRFASNGPAAPEIVVPSVHWTTVKRLTESPEAMKLFQQERSILEITELICEELHRQHVSRADLARRLDTTKGYVTQLLDGARNMTVRTISDVFFNVGKSVHFFVRDLHVSDACGSVIDFDPDWDEVTDIETDVIFVSDFFGTTISGSSVRH